MRLMFCILIPLVGQDDPFQELQNVRRSIREKSVAAQELHKSAHEALDLGEYETATSRHRKSVELGKAISELKKSELALIEKAIPLLITLLDEESAEVRDQASARLLVLGPKALPFLEGREKEGSVEAKSRLAGVLVRLRLATLDQEGRIRQWAVSARASSEYSNTNWSAMQATGKPDTFQAGDQRTAWASQFPDKGEEWLELTYDREVLPTHVRINETFNPGAVRKVEAQDAQGNWRVLWTGQDPTIDCPGWFTVAFKQPPFAVKSVRVVIDSAAVPGWNEIDAVELVGDPVQ